MSVKRCEAILAKAQHLHREQTYKQRIHALVIYVPHTDVYKDFTTKHTQELNLLSNVQNVII